MGTEATAFFEMPLFLSHDITEQQYRKNNNQKKSE